MIRKSRYYKKYLLLGMVSLFLSHASCISHAVIPKEIELTSVSLPVSFVPEITELPTEFLHSEPRVYDPLDIKNIILSRLERAIFEKDAESSTALCMLFVTVTGSGTQTQPILAGREFLECLFSEPQHQGTVGAIAKYLQDIAYTSEPHLSIQNFYCKLYNELKIKETIGDALTLNILFQTQENKH